MDKAPVPTVGRQLGLNPEEANAIYLQALGWAVEYDLGLVEETPPGG